MRRLPWSAAGLIALAALAVVYARETPRVRPVSAPESEFSAERAMADVKLIAYRPHPTGSDAHAMVISYITGRLRALGLEPTVQDVTGVGTRYAVAGRVRNIVARIPGRSHEKAVLIAAHYDGVGAGPSASDDAAGSAALLETIRALKAGPQLANDVIVLFTDSEEQGLLGAAAFVREHPWAKDVAVILNFEARGVNGPSFMFETGPGNLDMARVLRRVGGARATSLSTEVYRRLPNDTDLSEFSALGLPAMNFAFIGGVERYHTAEDDPTHLEPGSLQHHGNQMLGAARELANSPLPRPETSDAVFFFLPGIGTIAYSVTWALAFTILLVAVAIGAMWPAVRVQPVGVLAGFSGALASPFLGGAIGWALATAFLRLHLFVGSGSPRTSGIYSVAIALVVIGVVWLVQWRLMRRIGEVAVEAGTIAWWALVATLVSTLLPGAGFMFVWPTLLSGVAALLRWRFANARPVVQRLSAAFVVVMFAPLAYSMVSVALGLDAMGGAILGVLVAAAASLVAPTVIQPIATEWKTPAAIGAGGLAVALVGALVVRTSAAHPVGTALQLVGDADSTGAWLTGYANGPRGAAWVGATLDAAKSAEREVPRWLRRAAGSRRVVAASLDGLLPAAPTVTMLKDSAAADARYVTLRIKAARGTLAVGVALDSASVATAWVDGREMTRTRLRRQRPQWSLEFIAPPDTGFTVRLRLDRADRPVLDVTARSAGVSKLLRSPPPRPAGVLAIQDGDMTHMHRRVRF